jgi:glycosyltransferase involved in cell wall biosynthesis
MYAAGRIAELYGVKARVVPELIDLGAWRALLAAHPAAPAAERFTVLCVCRLYPRKRVGLLLEAAAQLRDRVPGLEIRIVGDGPAAARWRAQWRELRLGGTVRWLGNLPRSALAREYNGCDLFCLPSVQEGFGIVFLEAMAAGKPIVAARAAAVPEVARHGALCEPESAEALAEAILEMHGRPARRLALGEAGARWVEQFDAPRVGMLFLDEIRAACGA